MQPDRRRPLQYWFKDYTEHTRYGQIRGTHLPLSYPFVPPPTHYIQPLANSGYAIMWWARTESDPDGRGEAGQQGHRDHRRPQQLTALLLHKTRDVCLRVLRQIRPRGNISRSPLHYACAVRIKLHGIFSNLLFFLICPLVIFEDW